jgi:4-hydroxybenzoate polyprenyltransferase
MPLPKALLKAIRPKQFPKNLFVYTALVFSNNLLDSVRFGYVTLAFLLFCLASGSIYLLNDLLDVEADRLHPEKRNRPIASGALPVSVAKGMFVLLLLVSVGISFALGWKFGATVAAYLVLQIVYCLRWKHVVLLDVFTIAAGFVLRTVAGAVVIQVPISQWLLLFSLQLALFLGFGKRRQEIVLLGEDAEKHRAILEDYSLPFLDQMINVVAGVTIVCYSVYSVESATAKQHPHLWITVPLVIYGICRYLYLVHQKGWGGAPDEALRKDRSLQVAILLWLITVFALFGLDKVK